MSGCTDEDIREKEELVYERNYMKENNDRYILLASILFLVGVILILFFGFGGHKLIKKCFSTQSDNENGGAADNENPV